MNLLAVSTRKKLIKPFHYSKNRGSKAQILFRYIFHTLPRVQRLLQYWKAEAGLCEDKELRTQALNSLSGKDFHCQGGAVYAVPYPEKEDLLLRLIVAYQTLCDYLDNLCDRADCLDGEAFQELHESLLDALDPGGELHDYYRSYPYRDDSGYIVKMVEECRCCLQQIPSYNVVCEDIRNLARLYIDLQVKKHIDWSQREKVLIDWAAASLSDYSDILWNEFAAASGSTLAIFALFGLATRIDIERNEIQALLTTYFPWICGLHIMLDYFIDQEEDRSGGDLNFTFYYPDPKTMINRLSFLIRESHLRASQLPRPAFEKTVIEGLLAMYFSDKKIKKQGFGKIAAELINSSGRGTQNTYRLCSLVRKFI